MALDILILCALIRTDCAKGDNIGEVSEGYPKFKLTTTYNIDDDSLQSKHSLLYSGTLSVHNNIIPINQNSKSNEIPAGSWSPWSAWSTCSGDCVRVRRRQCVGGSCSGSTLEHASCVDGLCANGLSEYFAIPIITTCVSMLHDPVILGSYVAAKLHAPGLCWNNSVWMEKSECRLHYVGIFLCK